MLINHTFLMMVYFQIGLNMGNVSIRDGGYRMKVNNKYGYFDIGAEIQVIVTLIQIAVVSISIKEHTLKILFIVMAILRWTQQLHIYKQLISEKQVISQLVAHWKCI